MIIHTPTSDNTKNIQTKLNDAPPSASASNMDTATGAVTIHASSISHTLTINGALADKAEISFKITNNMVLATSAIFASSNKNVDINVHSATAGELNVRVKNRSGGAIADNTEIIINICIL